MNFHPLKDFVLVLPDPEVEKEGSIYIPTGTVSPGHKAGPSSHGFIGTVVAIGPGDKLFEWYCWYCNAVKHTTKRGAPKCKCGLMMELSDTKRHPMLVKVGDRVIYPRRASAPGVFEELTVIDGVGYALFNEEQNALAILEPE